MVAGRGGGVYEVKVVSVDAGGGDVGDSGFTVFCISTGVFSCGGGVDHEEDESGDENGQEMDMPELGHGGEGTELVPRMIQTLAGKEVIGVAAGVRHTTAWTKAGELSALGPGGGGARGRARVRDQEPGPGLGQGPGPGPGQEPGPGPGQEPGPGPGQGPGPGPGPGPRTRPRPGPRSRSQHFRSGSKWKSTQSLAPVTSKPRKNHSRRIPRVLASITALLNLAVRPHSGGFTPCVCRKAAHAARSEVFSQPARVAGARKPHWPPEVCFAQAWFCRSSSDAGKGRSEVRFRSPCIR